MAVSILYSYQDCVRVPIVPQGSLEALAIVNNFKFSHSHRHVVVSHGFSVSLMILNIFSCAYLAYVIFDEYLGKNIAHSQVSCLLSCVFFFHMLSFEGSVCLGYKLLGR